MRGLKIKKAPSLAELTSIRLGGTAIAEITLEDLHGFDALPEALARLGGQPVALGRGSNIIAAGGELPLVLLRLGSERGGELHSDKAETLRDYENEALFGAWGGMPLPLLVNQLSRGGFAGFSGLVGVPGSLGGAVAMNAGSFGMDIKGCLRRVLLFSPRLGLFTREAEELDISYRHFAVSGLVEGRLNDSGSVADTSSSASDGKGSVAGNWFLVVRAEFLCRKAEADLLRHEMEEFYARKSSSQPVGARSAGCVFKNHAAGPAGRLLEEAGFKGKALGGMMFSDLHANFLINTGRGTPAEAFELIELARRAVLEKCGAALEPEVRLWA
ncbi:MAG: FAD-binding protein [Deltaproteobacteria bacterium]|jgi:UDP-N-acetylmuramate dehydrogenase|nr:FAD-binding protein [Deltaproteobacteria bacterium]